MSNPQDNTASILQKNKKVLIASLTGSAIEWFDYFLYGTAAALVFNKIFFPMVDPVIGLILSWLSFSLTFFIRPIGGVIFAHIGDRPAAHLRDGGPLGAGPADYSAHYSGHGYRRRMGRRAAAGL